MKKIFGIDYSDCGDCIVVQRVEIEEDNTIRKVIDFLITRRQGEVINVSKDQ